MGLLPLPGVTLSTERYGPTSIFSGVKALTGQCTQLGLAPLILNQAVVKWLAFASQENEDPRHASMSLASEAVSWRREGRGPGRDAQSPAGGRRCSGCTCCLSSGTLMEVLAGGGVAPRVKWGN